MVAALVVLFVVVLVAGVALALYLRRWTLAEARTEDRLHAPGTPKVTYVVPEGQDVAVLMTALTAAGFVCVTDSRNGVERLLVACDAVDRPRVRSVIAHVTRAGLDGPEIDVAEVRFGEDSQPSPS